MIAGKAGNKFFAAGEDFATALPTSDIFVPTVEMDWCGPGIGSFCQSIDLSNWSDEANILLMFECVNGHGNMMYIDDIVISGTPTVSVPEFVTYDAFSVLPKSF